MIVEKLDGKKHDRHLFECDNQELNLYLKTQASQDVREGYCQIYVVTDQQENNKKTKIYGFFSISHSTLEYNQIQELPEKYRKRYSVVPSILLGRLAKDKNQTILTGSELLLLALREAKEAYFKLGGVFIVTHPKDKRAKNFYLKHGFSELPSNDKILIFPTKDIP